MSNLASLLTMDSGIGGTETWLFDHNQDHNLLLGTVQTNTGKTQTFYILGAVYGRNMQDWLLDHQRAHDDLCAATGVIGNDLQNVDFEDPRQRDAWFQLNESEHAAFHVALKV